MLKLISIARTKETIQMLLRVMGALPVSLVMVQTVYYNSLIYRGPTESARRRR